MLPQSPEYKEFVLYVAAVYEQAEIAILEVINKRLAADLEVPDWVALKYAELTAVNVEIKEVLTRIVTPARNVFIQGIEKAYNAGYGTPGSLYAATGNKQALAALTKELLDKIDSQFLQILRSADDLYRRVIAEVVSLTSTGAITREQAASRALVKFADNGITGFTDKRGRNWGIAEYTEMATRTALTRSYAEGNVNKYVDEGYDLIYIPTSPEPCPMCDPLENKVYSAAGVTPGYPLLREAISAGMFHPNCTHRAVPYIKGLTRIADRAPKKERAAHYDERQKQRAIERDIRKYKRRAAIAITPADKKAANDRVKFHQAKMRKFIEDTGRLRSSRRENLGIPKRPDLT